MVLCRSGSFGLENVRYAFGLSLSKPGRAGLKCALVLRAEAGLSPRRATHFSLLRQRKVSKRKATPSLRPLRVAKGQTCGGAAAGCAVELTALRCSFVQTSTASQCTRHGRSDAHAHPATAPPQAQPAGGWAPEYPTAEQPHGPLFRSASPRGRKRHALRKLGRAKQWPERMSAPRVPFRMRRGAQRPADQGSRLFERSETKRVRARPRWARVPQVSPHARKGVWGRSV